MTSERWQQINVLLDAVLDLPPGEQQAYLDVYCPDPELRREVESLLEAHDEARSFLEEPAKEYAAPLIPMTNDLSPDRLVGQEIDGYQILDVLGRGGMGIVYKARDVNLDKVVALKMIDPALARDEVFLRRFRGEARALARIDSPHIVRVHAMRSTEVGLYIVMEYVDGGTLTELLYDGPVPWRRALPIIRQMLTALDHAHSVHIIHRDIKPSNIMLTAKGEVKVTDFGLAKVRKADGLATATQGISGTLFYMSPEQVEGLADLDHRSDLYSMGLTIYQMLTGRLPLDRDAGDFAIMRAIVEDPMPPPSTFKPDLPESLVRGVMKALEKDPAQRYQDAAEMREAFDVLVEDTAQDETMIGALPPYRRERPSHQRERPSHQRERPSHRQERPPRPMPRRALWIGGGVLGVVALVLIAILSWPSAPALAPPRLSVSTNPEGAAVVKEGGEAAQDRATLEISSTPGDARVRINGYERGNTDASGQFPGVEVKAESVLVEIFKEGYTPWSETFQVEAGETRPINATLESDIDDPPPPETATLTLQAVPGGTVSVAGENCRLGVPCTVQAGDKRIVFRYKNHMCTRTLQLNAGARQSLTCYFEHRLNVQVRTEDGNPISATILINNIEIDQISDRWYPVTVQKFGILINDIEVNRTSDKRYTVTVQKFGYDVLTAPQEVTFETVFEKPPDKKAVFLIREQ